MKASAVFITTWKELPACLASMCVRVHVTKQAVKHVFLKWKSLKKKKYILNRFPVHAKIIQGDSWFLHKLKKAYLNYSANLAYYKLQFCFCFIFSLHSSGRSWRSQKRFEKSNKKITFYRLKSLKINLFYSS